MKPSAPSSIAEGLVIWRPSGRETQERHPRSRRVWWHGAHPGVRHRSAILDRGGLGPPAGRKSRRSTMQPQPSACARQPPRRRPSRRSDFTPRSRRRRIAESRPAVAEAPSRQNAARRPPPPPAIAKKRFHTPTAAKAHSRKPPRCGRSLSQQKPSQQKPSRQKPPGKNLPAKTSRQKPPGKTPSRQAPSRQKTSRQKTSRQKTSRQKPPGKNLPAKTSRQKPPGKNAALLRAGSPGEAPRRRQAPSFQTARPWPPAFFPPARRRPRARPWWKRAWSRSCRPQQPRAWADSHRGRWRKAG